MATTPATAEHVTVEGGGGIDTNIGTCGDQNIGVAKDVAVLTAAIDIAINITTVDGHRSTIHITIVLQGIGGKAPTCTEHVTAVDKGDSVDIGWHTHLTVITDNDDRLVLDRA